VSTITLLLTVLTQVICIYLSYELKPSIPYVWFWKGVTFSRLTVYAKLYRFAPSNIMCKCLSKTHLNDPFVLPSLEQIEQMEKQRSQAIESLGISNGLVKCQKCGDTVPLLRTSTKPRSNRIDALQKRVKWIEIILVHVMTIYTKKKASITFLKCKVNHHYVRSFYLINQIAKQQAEKYFTVRLP
jgi:hypothetical protein